MKTKLHFNRKYRFLSISCLLYFLTITQLGCKKLVEVQMPDTQLSSKNVYDDDATAIAAITGIYAKISVNGILSDNIRAISALAGLSADELALHQSINNDRLSAYYKNDLKTIVTSSSIWQTTYTSLYTVNEAVENLSIADKLSPKVRRQLTGEAKFLRAFYYFYLVNLYGDVPLVTTTNYTVNETIPRSTKEDVYKQIVQDLLDAKSMLSENFLGSDLITSTSERVRPTKWAASALLARVYLYMENWADAEKEATILINQSTLFKIEILNNAFKKTSLEAIWQLQPVTTGRNTEEAWTFVIPSKGFNNSNPVYVSNSLLSAFETNDNRKSAWLGIYTDKAVTPNVDYYYPFKYQSATLNASVTEYLIVFRLAEQYLIRAEARAHLGNLSGANADLNVIRNRAGLTNANYSTAETLLTAIMHERQVELFTEWGHRWLDLKRTGNADAVMSVETTKKGGTWNTNWQLYPIFLGDIQSNPNLKQNPGYN